MANAPDAMSVDELPDDDMFNDTVAVAEVARAQPSPATSCAPGIAESPVVVGAGGMSTSTPADADMPQIDAPPGMSPTAVFAARAALRAGHRPDLCKLCVAEPKVGKVAWCRGCRRKVEAAEFQARQKDLALNDGTPNMDHVEALKASSNLTQLRLLIFDFEARTNPTGACSGRSGARRQSYDFLQYEEFSSSSTVRQHMDVIKPLTKFKFLKYFTEEEGWAPQKALGEWEKRLTSKNPRDYNGEDGEVRLDTKVDEVKYHGSEMRKGNMMRGMMKQKKAPKEGDIEAVKENLAQRHVGFDDEFWAPMGGGENLKHVPGASLGHGFAQDGDIVIGAGSAKRTASQAFQSSASSTGGAEDSGAKAPRLKDRESKLNKLRNDLTDVVAQEERSALELVSKESEMRGVLSDEELRATDYAPLVSTFDVRMFGLKLAIANDVDVVAGFREFGFLRDGDAPMGAERESKENEGGGDCKDAPQEAGGKVSEAELKAKTRPAQITCFAECLKAARRALPIADFALISTRDALVDRIPTVGESVETACDLKEARREFIGHSERLRELVKATKRAAEDIKSRKCAKASKVTREIQKQQHEMSKQAKAASSQAAKAQKRAAQEEVNRQKKLQEQAAAELSGQAGAPEWTIMDVDLQHHAALPEYAADNFPGSDVNFDAPYLVKDVKLQAVLKKHESVINIWLAGFDRSEVVLSKGRSSWPLQDAPEVRGELLKYGPPSLTDVMPGNQAYNAILSRVSLFGYAATMRNSSGEVQSMGSLRWQMEGSRRVIIANVADVVGYLQKEAKPVVARPTASDVSAMLKFADVVSVTALRARGARLHFGVVGPHDVLFQPAGWWVLEVPTNGQRNFGIHTCILPKVKPTSQTAASYK